MIAYDLSNFPIFKNLSVLNNLSVLKKLCFGTIAIHLSKLSDGATVLENKDSNFIINDQYHTVSCIVITFSDNTKTKM